MLNTGSPKVFCFCFCFLNILVVFKPTNAFILTCWSCVHYLTGDILYTCLTCVSILSFDGV